MFDLGWTELLLVGIVALIVVGPKNFLYCSGRQGNSSVKLEGWLVNFREL